MAVDLSNSPYAQSLRPQNRAQDGLGYSRHYAQKIRELGKSSKESWIKRLWNHMFAQNKANGGGKPAMIHGKVGLASRTSKPQVSFTATSTRQKTTLGGSETSRSQTSYPASRSAPPRSSTALHDSHDLGNSPYLPQRERIPGHHEAVKQEPAFKTREPKEKEKLTAYGWRPGRPLNSVATMKLERQAKAAAVRALKVSIETLVQASHKT